MQIKKRYCLTEEGERFLEEKEDFIEKMQVKFEPFASSVIGSWSFPFTPMESLPDSFVESTGRLMRLFFELRGAWTKSSDDKLAKDLTRLYDELSDKLDSLLESYCS